MNAFAFTRPGCFCPDLACQHSAGTVLAAPEMTGPAFSTRLSRGLARAAAGEGTPSVEVNLQEEPVANAAKPRKTRMQLKTTAGLHSILTLTQLPEELLLHIAAELHVEEIARMGRCCWALHKISLNGVLWQDIHFARSSFGCKESTQAMNDESEASRIRTEAYIRRRHKA